MPVPALITKVSATLCLGLMALTASCGLIAPTPDWTLERIKRDRLAENLLIEADALAIEIYPPGRGALGEFHQMRMRWNVPGYMATACVEGKQPTVEGFKSFVRSSGRDPSRVAKRAIGAIKAADDEWQANNLDAVTQHCLRPYLSPESVSDAAPAVDLYTATAVVSFAPDLRDSFESVVRRRAGGWFKTVDQHEPFISWLCATSSDGC